MGKKYEEFTVKQALNGWQLDAEWKTKDSDGDWDWEHDNYVFQTIEEVVAKIKELTK